MMGPPTQQYNGAHYAPITEQTLMLQSQDGWIAPPVVHQSMPQMHNNIYMPLGTMPPQTAPGMMQFPRHIQIQHVTPMSQIDQQLGSRVSESRSEDYHLN